MHAHPRSAAVLLAAGVLGLATWGFSSPAQTTSVPAGSVASAGAPTPALIAYLAHPRDYVRIVEGTPYTVPEGKLLVVTQLGILDPTSTPAIVRLLVNSDMKQESTADHYQPHVELVPGIVASEGDLVEAFATSDNRIGSVIGFLADA